MNIESARRFFISFFMLSGALFWISLILDFTAGTSMRLITFVFWFYIIPVETGFMLYISLIFILAGIIERRFKRNSMTK